MDIDEITGQIVDSAYRLHTRLGPGLLENVYETILFEMLVKRGIRVQRQHPVTFEFDGILFTKGLQLDLLVEDRVIVELKSVEKPAPVHRKQLLTYLRLMNLEVGLLINFGEVRLKDGIRRVVNGFAPSAGSAMRVNRTGSS